MPTAEPAAAPPVGQTCMCSRPSGPSAAAEPARPVGRAVAPPVSAPPLPVTARRSSPCRRAPGRQTVPPSGRVLASKQLGVPRVRTVPRRKPFGGRRPAASLSFISLSVFQGVRPSGHLGPNSQSGRRPSASVALLGRGRQASGPVGRGRRRGGSLAPPASVAEPPTEGRRLGVRPPKAPAAWHPSL